MTNEKELIERLALEIARKSWFAIVRQQTSQTMSDIYPAPHSEKAIVEFATMLISRYLAERGKEASAYGVMWKIGDGSEVLQFPLATTEGEAKSDLSMYSKGDQENMRIVPLFLAPPAIPEGMALVPIEPTEAMVLAAWSHPKFGQSSDDMAVTMAQAYKNMIAAAPEMKP